MLSLNKSESISAIPTEYYGIPGRYGRERIVNVVVVVKEVDDFIVDQNNRTWRGTETEAEAAVVIWSPCGRDGRI